MGSENEFITIAVSKKPDSADDELSIGVEKFYFRFPDLDSENGMVFSQWCRDNETLFNEIDARCNMPDGNSYEGFTEILHKALQGDYFTIKMERSKTKENAFILRSTNFISFLSILKGRLSILHLEKYGSGIFPSKL